MPLLSVSGLKKSFGGLRALDDLTFDVEEGKIIGVIGPNGAGKSTLFAVLTGFYPATEGAWWLDGKPLRGLPPEEICRRGMVRTFQIVQPFAGMTVLENAMVAAVSRSPTRASAMRRAEEALEWVGLSSKRNLPVPSLTLADKKALEMAKACASGARLILLDEVMAGLRPGEVDRVVATILTLREQRKLTFLIVEHNMGMIAELCDRVVVLAEGKRLAEGRFDEVRADERVQTAYLGSRH